MRGRRRDSHARTGRPRRIAGSSGTARPPRRACGRSRRSRSISPRISQRMVTWLEKPGGLFWVSHIRCWVADTPNEGAMKSPRPGGIPAERARRLQHPRTVRPDGPSPLRSAELVHRRAAQARSSSRPCCRPARFHPARVCLASRAVRPQYARRRGARGRQTSTARQGPVGRRLGSRGSVAGTTDLATCRMAVLGTGIG